MHAQLCHHAPGAAPRAAPAVAGVARGRVGVGAVEAGVGIEGGLVRVGAAVRERLAPAAPPDIPQAGRVLQARRGLRRQRLRAPAPAGLASGGLVRPLAQTLGTSVGASPMSPAALRSSAAAWTAGLCALRGTPGAAGTRWPGQQEWRLRSVSGSLAATCARGTCAWLRCAE